MPVSMVAILVALAGHHAEPQRGGHDRIGCGVELAFEGGGRCAVRSGGFAAVVIGTAGFESDEFEVMNAVLFRAHFGPWRLDPITQIFLQSVAHPRFARCGRAGTFDFMRRWHGLILGLGTLDLLGFFKGHAVVVARGALGQARPDDARRVGDFANTRSGGLERSCGSGLCQPRGCERGSGGGLDEAAAV